MRQGGPLKLRDRVKTVLGAYDAAGSAGAETFRLHVHDSGQHLRHPQMPGLPLPGPEPGALRSKRRGGESDGPRPGRLATR